MSVSENRVLTRILGPKTEELAMIREKRVLRDVMICNLYHILSSSSYVCRGVRPLVDPFRSYVTRSLFRGLPRFLLPIGE